MVPVDRNGLACTQSATTALLPQRRLAFALCDPVIVADPSGFICMLAFMSDQMYRPVPLHFERSPEDEMATRGRGLLELMARRRSVREFAPDPVPRELIEIAISVANTAPSGANRQPWHFAVISDPSVKAEIRRGAEAEEKEFYEGGRATEEWLKALAPLGTDWRKPFLEIAPWLVVVFKQIHRSGRRQTHQLLRQRKCRYRLWSVHCGHPSDGPCNPHPHSTTDAVPDQDSEQARKRTPLRPVSDRLPAPRMSGAGDLEKALAGRQYLVRGRVSASPDRDSVILEEAADER
jgi:hypothetical protein